MIKSIIEELKTSNLPVAKALYKTADSKTLCIGFNKNMELKEHKTNAPTKLVVIEGEIEYIEGEKKYALSKFSEYDIPLKVVHKVIALQDSIILLLQG